MFRAERDPETRAPGTRIASAISSWLRACRSFSGAASRTTSCSTLAERGHAAGPRRCSTQQVRRMLADPRSDALVRNFAGQWLHLRNLRTRAAQSDEFPDFDDNLRQAFRRETELLFESIMREDRSVTRSAVGGLHLRQRTAGSALRNPERLRQPVPPGHGDGRGAEGSAGPGKHSGGDLARQADVAGAARQVDSREPAGHAAAAAAAGRAAAQGERRRSAAARPCASRWRSTGRTRSARAATA